MSRRRRGAAVVIRAAVSFEVVSGADRCLLQTRIRRREVAFWS